MKILLSTIFLFIILTGKSQVISPENRIVVLGQAMISIPADRLTFKITIQSSDSSDAKKAFEQHKILESKLVFLLKELEIPNQNVQYNLISIGKLIDYYKIDKKIISIGTKQQINVNIDDPKRYSQIIIKLINSGFTEIEASFSSTKINEFNDKLIENAIEAAKQKANSMAKYSDRKIKRILKIVDTEEDDPNIYGNEMVRIASYFSTNDNEIGNLTEIPQVIHLKKKCKSSF